MVGVYVKFKGPEQTPVSRDLDCLGASYDISGWPEMVWAQFALDLELVD